MIIGISILTVTVTGIITHIITRVRRGEARESPWTQRRREGQEGTGSLRFASVRFRTFRKLIRTFNGSVRFCSTGSVRFLTPFWRVEIAKSMKLYLSVGCHACTSETRPATGLLERRHLHEASNCIPPTSHFGCSSDVHGGSSVACCLDPTKWISVNTTRMYTYVCIYIYIYIYWLSIYHIQYTMIYVNILWYAVLIYYVQHVNQAISRVANLPASCGGTAPARCLCYDSYYHVYHG